MIGTTVRIDGAPNTIVGVADARVAFPAANVGFFTLMDLDAVGTAPYELGIEVVARVKPGLALAAVIGDASRVIQDVARENPGPHSTPGGDVSGYRAIVKPLRDDMAGGITPTIALLTAAVLFVLCLTCVNVATLELVRSSGRRPEFAIRSALGADRSRLIFGALVEGGVQAIAGVVLGLALSALSVRVLLALVPESFGSAAERALSAGILAGAAAMVVLCTAASGAFPIAATLSSDVQSALRDRGASATRRMTWVRRSLIVVQLAFACILVDGAALMIVSVRQAQHVDFGFRPQGLVVFQLSLPRETYPVPADVATAFRTLTEKLRDVPGVSRVALATTTPLDAENDAVLIGVEGRPFRADGTDPGADYRSVSASYFETMGIRLLSGRAFREGDGYLDGTPAVISKALAALLFPDGSDPLGHRIRIGPFSPWMSIVGVVSDAKNRSLTLPSRPELYLPYAAPRSPKGIARDMSVVLRGGGALAGVQAAAQRTLMAANPDLPLYGVRRYEDVIANSQLREVTTMRTLTGLAIVALALAIAGSYAMLTFAVVQRRRELALRQAVGATGNDLVMMIGREMTQLLLMGIGAGITGTILLSQMLSRFLFGVSALDLRVTIVTLIIVAVSGLGAALTPALRAGAVDLMLVLRAE